jgi:hypothetical protein
MVGVGTDLVLEPADGQPAGVLPLLAASST